MSQTQPIVFNPRNAAETQRDAQRREIAAQVEQFLSHGGRIDVLQSPLREAGAPVGRVWWEAGAESIARL